MRNQNLHRLILSKATLLWPVLVLSFLFSFSQTTHINGVVNTYHRVVEVIPDQACVRVNNTSGLTAAAKVLLLQMKGATINTENSSSFGDTISLNNAGNYEVATVCAIIGDTVFLVHTLLNNYTPATGKVQLVKFGEYVSANVTGQVNAIPWNNAAGTGGVIALFAEEDLILNAPVSADASGFRGGGYLQSNEACNNSTSGYAYDASTISPFFGQRGAYKGEGIADITPAQSGGRGAPANGGGGGNNHNNSGGGGSNLNPGGQGGGNSSTSSCNAAFRGEAGRSLSSWGGRKIFLGGGGGAGHNNNAVFTLGGANGGGIVFIHAANIIGNGHKISASGGIGGNSQADGAGGGGGGGTIVMDVASYTGALTIEANGGTGGGSNDGLNFNLCYGGGGGGSGGVIYFPGALPAVTVTTFGGGGGLETGRHNESCVAPVPSVAGINGQVITNYTWQASASLASYCSAILPVILVSFRVSPSYKQVNIDWQMPNPELIDLFIIEKMSPERGWTAFSSIAANDIQQHYSATDPDPENGYNLYRLKITGKNNSVHYSPVRRIYINGIKEAFTVYPNPAVNKLKIEGSFSGTLYIKLLDVSGKIVLLKKVMMNNALEINLPGLHPGIYMLYINDNVRKLAVR